MSSGSGWAGLSTPVVGVLNCRVVPACAPGVDVTEENVPTYQYACTACGHQLEAVQSFADDPLTQCPACAGRLRKLFGSVGVVFKGSGFYRTDSRAAANGNGAKGDGANGHGGKNGKPAEKSGEKAGAAKQDKPAEKAAASSTGS